MYRSHLTGGNRGRKFIFVARETGCPGRKRKRKAGWQIERFAENPRKGESPTGRWKGVKSPTSKLCGTRTQRWPPGPDRAGRMGSRGSEGRRETTPRPPPRWGMGGRREPDPQGRGSQSTPGDRKVIGQRRWDVEAVRRFDAAREKGLSGRRSRAENRRHGTRKGGRPAAGISREG